MSGAATPIVRPLAAFVARGPRGNGHAEAGAASGDGCDIAVADTDDLDKMATHHEKPEQERWAAARPRGPSMAPATTGVPADEPVLTARGSGIPADADPDPATAGVPAAGGR